MCECLKHENSDNVHKSSFRFQANITHSLQIIQQRGLLLFFTTRCSVSPVILPLKGVLPVQQHRNTHRRLRLDLREGNRSPLMGTCCFQSATPSLCIPHVTASSQMKNLLVYLFYEVLKVMLRLDLMT